MRMDHINIRCSDLDTTRRFLETVMGLKTGERPDFPFPGFWMYDDTGRACAHLVGASARLGAAGPVDHVAIYCDDLAAQTARIEAAGLTIDYRAISGTDLRQGFVEGPDGLKYEIQGPA